MEISKNISVDVIDEQNDIMISITLHDGEAHTWINKEQAVKLIQHLKEQFGI